jgi:hypothetical protein
MLRSALAAMMVSMIVSSADAQSTSIPACDELLMKMYNCAMKEPDAVQANSLEILDLTRRQVTDGIRTQGKKFSEDYCKSMMLGYRQAGYSREYGCRF